MKIGKIIVTTAYSLLMSGVAFAEIAPAPTNSPALGLSVASEKISAVGDDYGEASSILRLFYDSSIGQASMEEQTPVYVEWNFREDKKSFALTQEKSNILTKPENSIMPLLVKALFEESPQGINVEVMKKDVHNWSNTITNAGIGAAAGAAGGWATPVGPVLGGVAGGAAGAVTGAWQDWRETEAQIEKDEERYRDGTNALRAAQRDQRRRRKENG